MSKEIAHQQAQDDSDRYYLSHGNDTHAEELQQKADKLFRQYGLIIGLFKE